MNRTDTDLRKLFGYMWRVAIFTALIFAVPVALLADKYPWIIIIPMLIGTGIFLRRIFRKPPQFPDGPEIISEDGN